MENYAPSRNQFRDDAEFEREMQIWCEENEPRYFVSYLDELALPFGKWVRVEVESLEQARDLCAKKDLPEDHPFIVVAPGGRIYDGEIIRPFGLNQPVYADRSINHLDGGSRADYLMAGIRRY